MSSSLVVRGIRFIDAGLVLGAVRLFNTGSCRWRVGRILKGIREGDNATDYKKANPAAIATRTPDLFMAFPS